MNDNSSVDNKRRKFLGGMAALAGVPLLNTVFSAQALAAGLPHLTDKDPSAMNLHYHQDATKAPRAARDGIPAKDEFCRTCMFVQAKTGTWRPCQIFPGKTVNQNGWCFSWTQQSS